MAPGHRDKHRGKRVDEGYVSDKVAKPVNANRNSRTIKVFGVLYAGSSPALITNPVRSGPLAEFMVNSLRDGWTG